MNLNRTFIGLDIGDSSIKLSVISKKGDTLYLNYANLLPVPSSGDGSPPNGERILRLKMAFKNSLLKKDLVVMNYLGKTPLIRYLKLPLMPENELEEAVKWEAQKIINEPIETKIIDYAVLQKREEGPTIQLDIILVAVDKTDISEGLATVRKAGIYPRVMDVNPLALLKVVELNHPGEANEDLIFIDMGSTKMDINICREGVLRFSRQIGRGGQDMTRAIMQLKAISFDEAERIKKEEGMLNPDLEGPLKEVVDQMALEIQRSMDYYRSQFREALFTRILLMGGTPLMPGFKEYFETHFDLPVILENPFSSIVCKSDVLKELMPLSPLWAGSVGLALRGKLSEIPS